MPRTPTWKGKWTHAKRASHASLHQLDSVPDEVVLDALSGHDFSRPLLTWKLGYRLTDKARRASLRDEIINQFPKKTDLVGLLNLFVLSMSCARSDRKKHTVP